MLFQSALQIKSLVADALRITVCAREIHGSNRQYQVHAPFKPEGEKKYIQSSKGYKS